MSRSTLWEFKISKKLFIVPFFSSPSEKLNLKSFVFVARADSSYLFCFGAPHVGFLSFQRGRLARELHALQIRPEELHGDQLCGVRPRGEDTDTILRLLSINILYTVNSLLHFLLLLMHTTICVLSKHHIFFYIVNPTGSIHLYCADSQIHTTGGGHR